MLMLLSFEIFSLRFSCKYLQNIVYIYPKIVLESSQCSLKEKKLTHTVTPSPANFDSVLSILDLITTV